MSRRTRKKNPEPVQVDRTELNKRNEILKMKREKLKRMTDLLGRSEEDDVDEKEIEPEDTNNEIISEVNSLLSNLGEKPISVIYRTREKGTEVARRDGSSLKVIHKVGLIEHQPKLRYAKEIQTTESRLATEEEETDVGVGGLSRSRKREEDEGEEESEEEGENDSPVGRKVDEEKRKSILQSESFKRFFDRKTLLVERVLSTKYDPLMDFSIDQRSSSSSGDKLVQVGEFSCDFCKDRSVTSVTWCEGKSYQNLFLGGYFKKQYGHSEHGGGVVVWSQFLSERPEYTFTCDHPISSAIFYKYNPQVIIGCTYYGEVCKWDMRVGKSEPVERNPVNFKSHQQPIFGMKIVGTNLSHNLLTLSLDGVICEWQKCELDKEPTNIQLVDAKTTSGGASNQMSEIHAKCLGIKEGSIDRFFIGGENGIMYSAYLYGTREGIDSRYEGHYGPITSIDFHTRNEFRDFCLTSSVDWSCILWNQKQNEKPIYTFSGFDSYVFDVKWSPVHPSMFATVDGSGWVKVYDLNKDTETPIAEVQVESKLSLNKLSWNSTGSHITVGSADGRLYLFKLADDVYSPAQNEGKEFRSTLIKLSNMSDIIL